MATVTKQGVANFTSYNESVSDIGEINITGIYEGVAFQQIINTGGASGVLYWSPSSQNFFYVTDLSQLGPDYLFVETILSVTV